MRTSLRLGIYIVVFIVVMSLSAYATMFFLIRGQPEVDVPDLAGLDAVAALKSLKDLGLNLKVRALDHNPTVPKNHVISQDPPPRTHLKVDREVKVVLSRGSATVNLPDLKGLSLDQAATILTQLRLAVGQVGYAYGAGPETGRDRVMVQTPEPLQIVPVETKIDLLVSLGPRPEYLIMPDLTGEPYYRALVILDRAGLVLSRFESQPLANWPAETVIIQDPEPGGRVAKGELVKVTINRSADSSQEDYRFRLLNYRIPNGLFRHELRFRVTIGSYLLELHHDWHPPGRSVDVIALIKGSPRGQIFDDGEEQLWTSAVIGEY
ncbi:MAG: PASTA domain-containing protein [Deltaproteobacteria bacterium]|nr:PASTA domain-containing protein [Deltaproteobacteria bacterium]